jgi:hypothetical protein
MRARIDRTRLPLLAAALLFAALSIISGRPREGWIVVRAVPAGGLITAADVQKETLPPGSVAAVGDYARRLLVPGTVLLPEDVASRPTVLEDSLTLNVGGAAATAVVPGAFIRLGTGSHGSLWLSPPVLVTQASGPGLSGLGGTLTVSGPPAVILALAKRAAESNVTWVVVTVGVP